MQLNNKKIHELKCWPEFFLPLKERTKEFELRKNDRDYKVGDYLLLREFDPGFEDGYTGRKTYRQVQEILAADRDCRTGTAEEYGDPEAQEISVWQVADKLPRCLHVTPPLHPDSFYTCISSGEVVMTQTRSQIKLEDRP